MEGSEGLETGECPPVDVGRKREGGGVGHPASCRFAGLSGIICLHCPDPSLHSQTFTPRSTILSSCSTTLRLNARRTATARSRTRTGPASSSAWRFAPLPSFDLGGHVQSDASPSSPGMLGRSKSLIRRSRSLLTFWRSSCDRTLVMSGSTCVRHDCLTPPPRPSC